MGNAIYLSDPAEVLTQKVMNAVTDTNRISIKIPGNPDVCTVYTYHKVFNPEESDNICSMCKNAQIGCVACKKLLAKKMNSIFEPIRERRHYYEEHRDEVRALIVAGSEKANGIGDDNLALIKEKMHVTI
jgi:tryptophanyl-tRNA synthetase